MIELLLLLGAMCLALASAAFCAGAETGFLSVSRGRITHLSREGSETAKIVEAAISNMSTTTTSLLIGNNISAVAFSSAAAAAASLLFPGSATARSLWSIVMAVVVLYASEFLPKLLCSSRPLRRTLRLARAFRIFSLVIAPLTKVAVALTSVFIPKGETKHRVTTSDLVRILQDRKDGVRLTDLESALISRILTIRRKGGEMTADAILRAIDD